MKIVLLLWSTGKTYFFAIQRSHNQSADPGEGGEAGDFCFLLFTRPEVGDGVAAVAGGRYPYYTP